MAHTAKFKMTDAMHILGHCMREKSKDGSYLKYHTKSLIDESRSNDNITLFYEGRTATDSKDYFRKRVAEIGIKRKDQVVLCDTVITLPQEYLDESREFKKSFFQSSAVFVGNRYGVENIIGIHIHQDETTPHMHVTWTPVRDGKFQCKNILNKQDMRTFHDDLAEHLYNKLQIPREYILNGKTKEAKNVDELRSGVVELKEEIESLRAQKEKLRTQIEATKEDGIYETLKELGKTIYYIDDRSSEHHNEVYYVNEKEERIYFDKYTDWYTGISAIMDKDIRKYETVKDDGKLRETEPERKRLKVVFHGHNSNDRGSIRIKKNNSMSR